MPTALTPKAPWAGRWLCSALVGVSLSPCPLTGYSDPPQTVVPNVDRRCVGQSALRGFVPTQPWLGF